MNYPKEEWEMFVKVLNQNMDTFTPADRASLLNDAFSLAESGHLSYDIPIKMTSYLKKEQSLIPWDTAFTSLKKIETLLEATKGYPDLRKVSLFCNSSINLRVLQIRSFDELNHTVFPFHFYFQYYISLIEGHYQRLGFKDEGTHVDKQNRLNILHMACRNGHTECRKEAGNSFLAWIKDKSAYIPPNLRNLVYRYGIFKLIMFTQIIDTLYILISKMQA